MESTASPTDEHGAARTDSASTDATPTDDLLTFTSLNRRLSAMSDYDTPSPKSRRWSRIGMLTVALAYLANRSARGQARKVRLNGRLS
jgi:hypothetical protein